MGEERINDNNDISIKSSGQSEEKKIIATQVNLKKENVNSESKATPFYEDFKKIGTIIGIIALALTAIYVGIEIMEKINRPTKKIMNLQSELDKLMIKVKDNEARIDIVLSRINELESTFYNTSMRETGLILPRSNFQQGDTIDLLQDGSIRIKIVQILPFDDWINLEIRTLETDAISAILNGNNDTFRFNFSEHTYVITFWSAREDSEGNRTAVLSVSRLSLEESR